MEGKRGVEPSSEYTRDLFAAIEQYRQRPKANRTPDELTAELKEERHAIDLIELEFSETSGAFVRTGEDGLDGSVSHIDWIRHACKMSSSAAADRVNVGEQLTKLPASAQAVADGEIGFAHFSVIARTASALAGSKTAAAFDEHQLLDPAREMSVGRLWHLARHVRHAADPEGVATDEAFAGERRWLRLSACEDGTVLIGGQLDSVGGAALRTALEPLARPAGKDDDRCQERRFGDALVELALHTLDSGVLPDRASQRPHLQVTTSLETLRGLVGSPAGEMEYSLPICSKTVQRLACDSTITRVVLGSDSLVIDVGRAKRVVSGSRRRALNTRDGHCQWPECDRPPSWSAAHHVVHWTRGGSTNLDNLILLCHRHHWMAHEGGWQLVRTDEGRLLTIPPPWRSYLAAREAA